MNRLLWLIKKVRLYPFRSFGIITGTFSLAVSILMVLISIPDDLSGDGIFTALLGYVFLGLLVGLFIVGPVLLTLYNILYLVLPHDSEIMYQRSKRMEWITIIFGGLCFLLAAGLYDTHWKADWWEQLYNAELHAPIATWTYPTLIPIAIIAAVGYLALYVARSHPLPPLVIVLSLGGLYLGAALCLILFIQLVKHNWILCVYLGNMLLIFLKLSRNWCCSTKTLPPALM